MNLFFLSTLENKPVIKVCIAVFITINAVVLALLVFGLGIGMLGLFLSVAWAYAAVKVVNHYILKKKPEDMDL